ncbi:hypothetical protein BJ875DRAFT_460702 [Amylocarpus encephaloides]|uniref:Extracellular membrane protein CFEM domain-containing protein n=1 Tax=Amylocarpus encephaloides TaxID=45428 RepID=A0A9P8C5Q0_9HELO|nr:hypothetical protein BJ875DRAFT_460702 [Amylocarpus encephaloides]
MHTPSTFVLGAIMALARVAIATPPACLLAALQVQTNPADLKSLCGTLQTSMTGNITEKCSGSAESAARRAYADTCLSSASVTIPFASSTSSASSSSRTGSTPSISGSTSSSSTSATSTASSTESGNSTATATSSSGTAATAAAGSGVGSGSAIAVPTGSATSTGAATTPSTLTTNAGQSKSPNFVMAIAPIVLAAGFAAQLSI